jgi:hypothetical protein
MTRYFGTDAFSRYLPQQAPQRSLEHFCGSIAFFADTASCRIIARADTAPRF